MTRIENIQSLKGNLRVSEPHNHDGVNSPQVAFSDLVGLSQVRFDYDPSSLADGVGETQDVTVGQARFGDYVLVSAPYDLQGILATAYVKSSGTASVRLQNETGGTIDLGSGTWRLLIIKMS